MRDKSLKLAFDVVSNSAMADLDLFGGICYAPEKEFHSEDA
jgi:hypothetical protein